ncbi:MAG TPA: hypothetical protein VFQ76_14925 [Longimicrobiaceae bacterium]|nr:hypothetical protein [Longimicrobiaceae bacterium]
MIRLRILAALAGLSLTACTGEGEPRREAAGIVPVALDSVVLRENDSLYLGAPTFMVGAPGGDLYVSDGMNGHVLRFARDGRPLVRYGKRGQGPGEMGTPVAASLLGDSLLAVADWRHNRASLFRQADGAFVRSVPNEGMPFWMEARGDTVWMSSVNLKRKTSLAAWRTAEDTVRYLSRLPREYERSPILLEAHPYATMARTGDTLLVGFTGHRGLFLTRPDGTVFDTVVVPAALRRGVPADILERFAKPMENDEIASMVSALVAMHRLPSGDFALMHMDVTAEGRLITAEGFLSVLSRDLGRACVDIPFRFRQDGRPVVAFRGDTLLVLEQRIVSETRAETSVRSYRVDTTGCRWIPTGGPASRASVAGRPRPRPAG